MSWLGVVLILAPTTLDDGQAIPESWCRRAEELSVSQAYHRHLTELRELEVLQKRNYCTARWTIENGTQPKR